VKFNPRDTTVWANLCTALSDEENPNAVRRFPTAAAREFHHPIASPFQASLAEEAEEVCARVEADDIDEPHGGTEPKKAEVVPVSHSVPTTGQQPLT
jgi:hypothetical protein